MKKYLLLIVSISLIGIGCKTTSNSSKTAQTLPIQGSWLLVLENGDKVTENIHVKNYTNTHFSWEMATNDSVIVRSASGSYKQRGNVVTETLNFVSPVNYYHRTTTTLEMEIRNDTLFTKGKMDLDGATWTEAHIRMK